MMGIEKEGGLVNFDPLSFVARLDLLLARDKYGQDFELVSASVEPCKAKGAAA